MALESATYINGLNVSNPASTDVVGQADDHLRMLKAVLKNTFPNINAAVTATPLALNEYTVPVGGIIMWSGSPSALPTGWKLCDGGTYAKSDGSGTLTAPDLRDKFVKGCGGSTTVPTAVPTIGTTGGSKTVTPTGTIGGTSITQAQLPSYNLTVTDGGHTHTATAVVTDPGHNHQSALVSGSNTGYGLGSNLAGVVGSSFGTYATTLTETKTAGITVAVTNASGTTGITVGSGGSGATHTHTATMDAQSNEPQFYTLAFIIKV